MFPANVANRKYAIELGADPYAKSADGYEPIYQVLNSPLNWEGNAAALEYLVNSGSPLAFPVDPKMSNIGYAIGTYVLTDAAAAVFRRQMTPELRSEICTAIDVNLSKTIRYQDNAPPYTHLLEIASQGGCAPMALSQKAMNSRT